MMRTKHMVMSVVALMAFIAVGSVFFAARNAGIALSIPQNQAALLVSADEAPREATVLTDTTRETTRALLTEKLRAIIAEEGITEAVSEPKTEVTVQSPVSETQGPLMCEGAGNVSVLSWGPVNMTIGEGARVIVSIEKQIDDTPRYVLQLPLEPRVIGEPQCVPLGMVGIALDGRIVQSDQPFKTESEGLAGYALDGFPLFGPYEDGALLMLSDLDQCHGHVHTILAEGVPVSMYHYHLTNDAPYPLGCMRGEPVLQ